MYKAKLKNNYGTIYGVEIHLEKGDHLGRFYHYPKGIDKFKEPKPGFVVTNNNGKTKKFIREGLYSQVHIYDNKIGESNFSFGGSKHER